MPDDFDVLNEDELKALLSHLDAFEAKEKGQITIKTDDELHQFILDDLGINVPRVAVCPGHDAPFDFIADLFFHRVLSAIVVANRGGGKTQDAAVLHFVFMRTIPGFECISVGAQEIQAKRAYQYFKNFQREACPELIDTSLISETIWKTGSKLEILTGSKSSVNGPHVPFCHRDEIELMDKEVYQESLGIEKGKTTKEGVKIPSMSLATSTRKTSMGLMQELMDESARAVKAGRKPPHKIYIFCIKEVVENQPHCRVAYPDLPDDEKCDCNLIQSGEWDEGQPRTFDQICDGAFARSQGFSPLQDTQKTFAATSKAMWDAQYECKRPYAEDISLDTFHLEKHGIRNFKIDPDNGPIYQSLDVGGTSPHCAEWGQLLDFELEVESYSGQPKRIPEGSLVIFREFYRAQLGNTDVIEHILQTEQELGINPVARFVDPQAKTMHLDMGRVGLKTTWPTNTREREEHLKKLRTRVNKMIFYIDVDACPMFIEEIFVWNINKPRKTFDHAVDSTLYLTSNIDALLEKGKAQGNTIATPGTLAKKAHTLPEIRVSGPEGEALKEDQEWRGSLWKSIS